MAQVTATLGGHIPERGPQALHTVPLPAVAAGETQVIEFTTNFAGSPSLNLTGWRTLLSSRADANANRMWTVVRSGPQSAGTVQISYGGAQATTIGVGYGVSGEPVAWYNNDATQTTYSGSIPPAPSIATRVESMTTSSVSSGNFPRSFATPAGTTAILPSATSDPPQDRTYTATGGIGMRVVRITTATAQTTYQPPQWKAADPDNEGASAGDSWRMHVVNWAPTTVAPTIPAVSVDAIAGYAPMPEIGVDVSSATQLKVGWNIRNMPSNTGVTSFEVFVTPAGTQTRTNPKVAAGGESGLMDLPGLLPGTSYTVSVRSVRAAGNGFAVTTYSAMAESTVTTSGPPSPPTDVTATATSGTTAVVSWTWVSGASMEIWVGKVSGGMALAGTVLTGANSYQVTGLTAGTDYQIQLRSRSGAQASDYTAIVNMRTPGGTTPPPAGGPPTAAPPAGDHEVSERVKRNLRLMMHR